MNIVTNSDHWFVDGNFKFCPEVFFQICRIHTGLGEKVFRCAFALLPNKSQATYTRLFHELFNTVDGNWPVTILLDFERNALNTIQNRKMKKASNFEIAKVQPQGVV